MAGSSSEIKNLFEIKRFEGTGFDLWKERMQGILFLKDCDGALQELKPQDMPQDAWETLNKKAVTYIKMGVSDDILLELKGLTYAFQVLEKLRASYENTTPVNQVHLMIQRMPLSIYPRSKVCSLSYRIRACLLLMTSLKPLFSL